MQICKAGGQSGVGHTQSLLLMGTESQLDPSVPGQKSYFLALFT